MGVMEQFQLNGKTALVTGCKRGIGRAFAQALAEADVLIIPIALPGGLDPEAAARVARSLEPKIVIPVGYKPAKSGHAAELATFLESMGAEPEEPVSRFTVQRRNVGDGRRVVLLESRG